MDSYQRPIITTVSFPDDAQIIASIRVKAKASSRWKLDEARVYDEISFRQSIVLKRIGKS